MEDQRTDLQKAINLVQAIRYVSIDKDNTEFRATVTCFQRDALKEVLEAAWKYDDLSNS